jgi:hypothetical protein
MFQFTHPDLGLISLGCLARRFDTRIPKLAALLTPEKRTALAPPPVSIDWTAKLPSGLGMMGNDSLGDCTCAAAYHAVQIWTANAQATIDTEPDANVIAFYSQACNYNPADPKTDQGGDEQTVLTSWLLQGLPLANGSRQKLTAFIEVDPSNQADVELTIAQNAVCYIGFNVPDYAMSTSGTWDVVPGTPNIVGGHAVVLAAYDAVGPTCITWGRLQKMTWAFFSQFTDEAYWPLDPDWFASTGICPAGQTPDQLEQLMSALRYAGQ